MQHLNFGLLTSKIYRDNKFLLLKSLRSWNFVIAALRNKCAHFGTVLRHRLKAFLGPHSLDDPMFPVSRTASMGFLRPQVGLLTALRCHTPHPIIYIKMHPYPKLNIILWCDYFCKNLFYNVNQRFIILIYNICISNHCVNLEIVGK